MVDWLSIFGRTLVLAPHADDEVLGCGGLVKRLVDEGYDVGVALATVGNVEFYHAGLVDENTRVQEFNAALDVLGVSRDENRRWILERGYESKMDTLPIASLVRKIDQLTDEFRPDTVLVPYPSFHQDHQVLFKAAFASLRPSPVQSWHMVAMYEYPFVSWNYEHLNGGQLYVNISGEILESKVEALLKHESQVRNAGHMISPEAVRIWAERRGFEAGCTHAEMYRILRLVI